jgi:hypothetical protein
MNPTDLKVIGATGVTLGIGFILGGIVTWTYSEGLYRFGVNIGTTYPYRDYAVPLLIAGFVLFVVGSAGLGRAYIGEQRPSETSPRQHPQTYPPETQFMFCTNCGTKLLPTAKFCSKCGTPIKKKEVLTSSERGDDSGWI